MRGQLISGSLLAGLAVCMCYAQEAATLIKEGHELWKAGKRDAAIEKYAEVNRIDPGNPYGHFGNGMQVAKQVSATDQMFLGLAKANLSFYLQSNADRGSGAEAERRRLAEATLNSVASNFNAVKGKADEQLGGFALHEGLKRVKQGERWGFTDASGRWVIQARFQLVRNFSDDLAPAKEGDRWGYIDKTGKFVIRPQFMDALSFENGIGQVTPEGEHAGFYRFIDKTGKYARNPNYR